MIQPEAADKNMVHARCMLDKYIYTGPNTGLLKRLCRALIPTRTHAGINTHSEKYV
jgi:hypothetical protein